MMPSLPEDINEERLRSELLLLPSIFPDKIIKTMAEFVNVYKQSQNETRRIFREVQKLACLILCILVSVAGSERSFSLLRRLSQKRLTGDHVIVKLIKEFVEKTPERHAVFGTII